MIVIKIRNNEKNKATSNKQIGDVHNKSLSNRLIRNKELEKRRDKRKINLEVFQNRKKNKVDKLRITYRICQCKKSQMLNDKRLMQGDSSTIELINRFRAVLNAMLEDEKGEYPKEEILSVSRELDDMIYYYYKTSEKESNG